MNGHITCERCGGIAIRSPLCGSCAYALGVPAWERIKMRADQVVTDAVLDRWMNEHPANPANKVSADEAQRWLANSCPTCLSDPCQCLPDSNPADRTYGGWLLTQNGYVKAKVHQAERTGGVAGTSLPVEEQSGVQLPSGPPDATDTEQQQRHEDMFSFEQFRDAQGRAT